MHNLSDGTMSICPHCETSMESPRYPAGRNICPNCGGPIRQDVAPPWTDVARVTNLAEAGFLTDELVGSGIEARIQQVDDFNALYDRWTAAYLIQVPAEAAEEAAAQIQQYLDEDIRRQNEEQSRAFSLSSQMMDPVFWRPVALIMLTGMASFMLGQRFSVEPAAPRLPANSLPSAVNAIGRPLFTEPTANIPRYRLSYDSQRQSWLLDADRNNDGKFDVRQRFRASGAAW